MLDRHNRESVFIGVTHDENQEAHNAATQPGSTVKSAQWDTDQPDELGTFLIKVLDVHADFAPNGITLLTAKLETGEDSTYEVTYQRRDTPADASPDEIAVLETSASQEVETTVFTNGTVAAGQYIYVVIPATDVNKAGGLTNFTID